MKIANGINGSYHIPYQNNGKDTKDAKYILKEHFFQDVKRMDVVNGEEENEPVQIGARSFTDKEWKDFLKKFDAVQDTVRELMKERHDKLEKEKLKNKELNKEKLKEMLDDKKLKEKTILEDLSYTYPTESSDGEVVLHVTEYKEKGIICRNAGKIEKYEWAIPFETFHSRRDSI